MSQKTVVSQDIKNFTPTRDWLLVPDPRITKKSGIILDEATAQSLQTNIVEVIAAGPTTQYVEKGDVVIFASVGAGMNINALVYKT